jgi:hypothetical protein
MFLAVAPFPYPENSNLGKCIWKLKAAVMAIFFVCKISRKNIYKDE